MMITKILIDPHAGEIAVGRVFSGIIRKGSELYVTGAGKSKVQLLSMMVGPDRISIDEIAAGNIAAVVGLKGAIIRNELIDYMKEINTKSGWEEVCTHYSLKY